MQNTGEWLLRVDIILPDISCDMLDRNMLSKRVALWSVVSVDLLAVTCNMSALYSSVIVRYCQHD